MHQNHTTEFHIHRINNLQKKNVQTVIAFHQHIIRLMGKFLYIVTRPFRTAVIRVQTVFVLMTS